MEKFTNFIVKYRWPVLAAILLLTIFFGYQLKYLRVDSNIVDSLPKNDSIVKTFKEVGKQFGGNEMGMVILKGDNVLRPETLSDIQKITDTLSETKGIYSVTSLINMVNFKIDSNDFQLNQLINENNWPHNLQQADSLKKEILANKMVTGNIISKDATATVILFTFQVDTDVSQVSQTIMKIMKGLHLHESYYLAGSPFLTKYVADVISHDLKKLIPISFLLIAGLLFLSFRSLRGVVLPLLTAILAIIWAMGIFVMMGFNLSMVSDNVPIIVLAVGSAYAIHVLNRVNQCEEKNAKKALIKSVSLIIVPVILAALTTMVGFLSFIFGSYLSMIRDFGLLAALGTFFSALLALIFVPAVLAVLPVKKLKNRNRPSQNESALMTRFILIPLNKLVIRHHKAILIVWGLLFATSIIGIFMIKRQVSVSGYFKPNHPASIADRIMNRDFGGTKPVFLLFKGDMQSPEVLKAMLNTEKYFKKNKYIIGVQSIADIVTKLNSGLSDGNKIPDSKRKIEQLWFLIGQQKDIGHLVNKELNRGIIIAKFDGKKNNAINNFKIYFHKYISAHPSNNYSVEITGMPFVNAQLDKSLVRSQMVSLSLAVFLIIAIVSFMMSSFLKGLFASLPILATISILFGAMGLTGIPLNIVTVLVASIAMGIGIDYAIHFISHFNQSMKTYKNVQLSVEDAILKSGRAILINFISVSAGFLVLIFSSLVPMIFFGLLIAFSMLGSSLGALTLLPAVILTEHKKFILN